MLMITNQWKRISAARLCAAGLCIVFILWFFLPSAGQTAAAQQEPGQQDLTYEVSVRAQIVPIFAVDAKGNPVYDLKEEDIEFYVNGKPAEFETFMGFTFEEEQGKDPGSGKAKPSPERINFIILDSVMTDSFGMKRGKEVAAAIVETSGANDAFIILESSQLIGFSYVIGPEKDKKKVVSAIKKISRARAARSFNANVLPESVSGRILSAGTKSNEAEMNNRMLALENIDVEMGRKMYEKEVAIFSYALSQLKYALKTITLPKNIFIISGGLQKKALKGIPTAGMRNSERYVENHTINFFKFLKNAAIAVNYGGSMLYLVNPQRVDKVDNNDSLKYMAELTGGKCFYGSNVENILEQVKNTTSAYYELGYYPDQHTADKVKITLKCKRKGIKLHTINYSERSKPYKEMPLFQKKLFALNVVTGGSWSRMVGKVEQTSYKKLHSPDEKTKLIEIKIPDEQQNSESDIFVMNLDPDTLKAAIAVKTKVLGDKETISIPLQKNRNQFVVLVEPAKTHCVFAEVK